MGPVDEPCPAAIERGRGGARGRRRRPGVPPLRLKPKGSRRPATKMDPSYARYCQVSAGVGADVTTPATVTAEGRNTGRPGFGGGGCIGRRRDGPVPGGRSAKRRLHWRVLEGRLRHDHGHEGPACRWRSFQRGRLRAFVPRSGGHGPLGRALALAVLPVVRPEYGRVRRRQHAPPEDVIGALLADHDRGRVDVAVGDGGHDR